MTIPIFPSLPGIGWDCKRTSVWNTNVQTAISGKEKRIALWSYPQYLWELNYEYLRSSTGHPEFQELMGFFNINQGRAGTFLYTDDTDYAVTGQPIGLGDGQTTTFQLVRASGGYTEPVFAPNTVTALYINTVALNPSTYAVASYGSANPGLVTFTTAPPAGAAITVDFSFYFPCRFEDDTLDFEIFLEQLWKASKVAFRSVK